MSRQLAFDLPVRTSRERGDFFIADSNAVALATIERWRDWPGHKMVLTGPAGAGKSHLAEVWASLTGAVVVPVRDLADVDIAALRGQSVAVEDADRIAGDAVAEAALFHLHNLVLAEGGSLLLTSRAAPARWDLDLPDLASRVQGTSMVALDAPDDALMSAVLVKLFDDRQIAVTPPLIAYLAPRLPRSLAAARAFVATLDDTALAEGKPVGRKLAARLLDKEGDTGA